MKFFRFIWLHMTLTEYLKMRREVEHAPKDIVAEAEKLAGEVKLRNMELVTTERMWQELIRLAEEKEGKGYQFKIFQE